MSSTAGRRDNPAARAALARRRQRAAQSLRPSSNAPSSSSAPPTESSRPPTTPPKTRNSTVDSTTRVTSLTKRASDKRKSPTERSVMDATHTTAATTSSTTASLALYTTATPKEALSNSKQAAEQATSILNAVTARNRYRSSSPKAQAQAASPSRLAQQEELLAASKRRRQVLASRYRLAPDAVQEIPKSPAFQAATSPSMSRKAQDTVVTNPDSPLLARLEKLDLSTTQKLHSSPSKVSMPRHQSGSPLVSPRNQLASPRAAPLPPPSPRAQSSSRLQTRPRSPSPIRHKTSSPWIERNVSQQMQRPRPAPVQTNEKSPSPTSLQARAMQMRRSPSPRQNSGANIRNSPSRQYESPVNSPSHSGRNSPIVERLSAMLLDTSITDLSTLADMTLHQIETPRNANTSMALTPTLGAQPLMSPQRSDFFMDPRKETTPSRMSYRPVTDSQHFDDQATLDPAKLQNIDSACLQSGSTIVLRSYSEPATLAIERQHDTKYSLVALKGHGLGREDEIFTIQKVISTSQTIEEGDAHDTPNIRYGDTVMFSSLAAQNRALGSRKFVNANGGESKVELGFFTTQGGKSEIWTLLKGDREVTVGRAAMAANGETSAHSRSTHSGVAMPAPVRSGDPIVLRNCYNGGVLSVDQNGRLVLLTDSYQHDQQSDDPSLLGRLQHHDRLYPTLNDTFQMILSSIPPCPSWVAARSGDERIFLTGSYLLQPRRNQRSAEFESTLFGGKTSMSSVWDAAQRHVTSDENLSPKTKERILVDEVIGSFLGLEGLHVRLKGTRGHTSSMDHFEFKLFEAEGVSFDVGLRNLVEQILPLSTSFVRVRNFVSSRHPGYEYGRVMQAFCEALDALLQDYVNFVAHLEWEFRKYTKAESLTMKSIYYQITPSLHSMSILENATVAVSECKGGELINALWSLDTRSYMGDSVAKKVLGILLQKASEPYMDMMSEWLQTGKLNDPYEEFMVGRSTSTGRAPFDGDSWLALFQINNEHVVQGIAPNDWTKDKILTTGKYWNAVHHCKLDSKEFPPPTKHSKIPPLPFNSDSSAIASFIDSNYQSASRVLVRVLMDHFKLIESLQIMKRYFLIDQGDFLMHYLDAAEQELLKPQDEISMGRLQHCLNMSVQTTEAYKEEWDPVSGTRIPPVTTCPLLPTGLRCRLSEETLVAHLDALYGGGIADQGPVTPSRRAYGTSTFGPTGIEVFTIDFPRVPFPISLLLSQKAMGDYKLLFRHLFFTKHVERRLICVWRDHQLLKKLDALRGLLGPTFLLRQRMLHFVQNLIYYMIFEVVESHWMDLRNAIDDKSTGVKSDKQQTVDNILRIHNTFLERTLEACLLTNSDLIRSLTKLLNTCLLFTDQMKRFMDTTKIVRNLGWASVVLGFLV